MAKVPKKPGTYKLDNGRRIRRFADGHVEFLPGGGKSRPAAGSTSADAPKRRKRRRPAPAYKQAYRWVKKNPIKSALAATALTVAAVPASRNAVVSGARTAATTAVALFR